MSSYNTAPDTLIKYCYPYPVIIPNCLKEIVFPMNNASTDMTFYFVDKHKKKYIFAATTDADGFAKIDTNFFPESLFNPYAGNFLVYATINGEPESDRLFFRSDVGYFPALTLGIADSYYTNVFELDQHNVSLSRFVCCCTRNTPCGNFAIDPCPEATSGTGGTTGTGTGGTSGTGGVNPKTVLCCDYVLNLGVPVKQNETVWEIPYSLLNNTSVPCVLPELSLNPTSVTDGWSLTPFTLEAGNHSFMITYKEPTDCYGGLFNVSFKASNAKCFAQNKNVVFSDASCDPVFPNTDFVAPNNDTFVFVRLINDNTDINPLPGSPFGPQINAGMFNTYSVGSTSFLDIPICCGAIDITKSKICIKHIFSQSATPRPTVGVNGIPFAEVCTLFNPISTANITWSPNLDNSIIYEVNYNPAFPSIIHFECIYNIRGFPGAGGHSGFTGRANYQISWEIFTDCPKCRRKFIFNVYNLPVNFP